MCSISKIIKFDNAGFFTKTYNSKGSGAKIK